MTRILYGLSGEGSGHSSRSKQMARHLESLGHEFEHLEFADHHEFSTQVLNKISSKSLVLTTEKDFSRLKILNHDALYYLPITTKIDDQDRFEDLVKAYIDMP